MCCDDEKRIYFYFREHDQRNNRAFNGISCSFYYYHDMPFNIMKLQIKYNVHNSHDT